MNTHSKHALHRHQLILSFHFLLSSSSMCDNRVLFCFLQTDRDVDGDDVVEQRTDNNIK